MHIEESILGILSDTDKQEFEVWQELLNSRGYKLLTEFLVEQDVGIQSTIENAANWDAYVFARGQRNVTSTILQLESILQSKIQTIVDDHVSEVLEDDPNEFDELEVNLGLADDLA